MLKVNLCKLAIKLKFFLFYECVHVVVKLRSISISVFSQHFTRVKNWMFN